MDKRKLGQLEVSPIGMGCMGFSHGYGQVPPEAYAIEAIRKAYDYGCTHFDTAEAYGKEQFYAGHNEELVGKAVEPFDRRRIGGDIASEQIADQHETVVDADMLAQLPAYPLLNFRCDVRMEGLLAEHFVHSRRSAAGKHLAEHLSLIHI